ncbi:DNA-binding transcriptional LysR family regulator [Virgibacillus natechei]|uniref:DNA-binding transcriptional LysR family regulator n=1 Tax=Virgibacillus natechei TaxID=1216297 RepID=A0ABS4IB65_9BACI|nr:LysR family transcriptional regulator [Virgibacillus natechei]MBP1968164.1 DNA-binding transcriptional LysR family regulator [Virgibacillus natechei]UZD14560.1 LysR family transcriptional regulator [Virgibacillus natechei]
MKIEDYALLLSLNKIGTIRGTAKSILISQPAVTQRLKYIEDYFGQAIFIRTPKRLVLTPSGEMILSHAALVIDQEQKIKNALAESSKEVQGTLSIACSSLISQRFLPAILGEFNTKFPKVAIDLVTGISEDIKRDHRNYHVCIIRGEKLKETTCVRLFDDPLFIFDTEPFPENKMKKRPLISFSSDDSMHELVDNWLYHHQGEIQPLRTITVDQIETCKQFMKQGLGMAVLPESVSDSMKDEYPHVPLKLNGEAVTRDTWVCYQEGARRLPQVDQFINALTTRSFL